MAKSKYETDQGNILRIRLSGAKLALAGTAPTGPLSEGGLFVSVSTSPRSQTRLRARGWVYSREVAVAGEDRLLIFYVFLPKLTPAAYNAIAPDTITYEGETYTFLSRRPEG